MGTWLRDINQMWIEKQQHVNWFLFEIGIAASSARFINWSRSQTIDVICSLMICKYQILCTYMKKLRWSLKFFNNACLLYFISLSQIHWTRTMFCCRKKEKIISVTDTQFIHSIYLYFKSMKLRIILSIYENKFMHHVKIVMRSCACILKQIRALSLALQNCIHILYSVNNSFSALREFIMIKGKILWLHLNAISYLSLYSF